MKKAASVYLHLPFCSRKCAYCDFAIRVLQNARQIERYFLHLALELEAIAPQATALHTLYIGGGTPSILSVSEIHALAPLLHSYFDLSRLSASGEWTLEVNPEHAKYEALLAWKQIGVNRISLGVQSFDNALLARCGRLHQQTDVFSAVQRIQDVGFDNWSLDLMYALPEQTLKQWQQSLEQALRLQPTHLSLYALEVHAQTLFGAQQLPAFSEDLAGDMYDLACEMLAQAGYLHYEIANFCLPGYASRHNQVYWQTEPFVAVGVGAHGYLQQRRYENPRSLKAYYQMCQSGQWSSQQQLPQTLSEAIEEFMFLGLRQLEKGVTWAAFETRFGISLRSCYPQRLATAFKQADLLPTAEGFVLNPERIGLSNRILSEFLDPVV
jgi:oxygen-independent coproporphyrinogen III oxidase